MFEKRESYIKFTKEELFEELTSMLFFIDDVAVSDILEKEVFFRYAIEIDDPQEVLNSLGIEEQVMAQRTIKEAIEYIDFEFSQTRDKVNGISYVENY